MNRRKKQSCSEYCYESMGYILHFWTSPADEHAEDAFIPWLINLLNRGDVCGQTRQ